MRLDDSVVEQIVQRVMAQLDEREPNPEPATSAVAEIAPAQQADRATAEASNSESSPLILTDPVLTEEVLAAQVRGVTRIRIGPRSIITPSGRDFLRSRQIGWERIASAESKQSTGGSWKALVACSTEALQSALNDLTGTAAISHQHNNHQHNSGNTNGNTWQRDLSGNTKEAVRTAIGGLCRAEAVGMVLFTEQPAMAACWANRNAEVRAAVVDSAAEIEPLRAELGPNLFCLDPREKSYFELRNLLRAIGQGGAPRVPPHGPTD